MDEELKTKSACYLHRRRALKSQTFLIQRMRGKGTKNFLKSNNKIQRIMKSLRSFKEYCGGSLAALVVPVKNQLGCDSVSEFWNELENVSRSYCGAAAGFTGFIYYSETVAFWRAYRAKITKCLEDLAENLGEDTLHMVCSFNSLKGYEYGEVARALYGNYNSDYDSIYNTFAWFALEEVANRYADYDYENR